MSSNNSVQGTDREGKICGICGMRPGKYDYSDPEDDTELWVCEVDYPYGNLMNERHTEYDFGGLRNV